MYQLFIGIDVSKYWIDAALLQESQPFNLGKFENNVEGFQALDKAIRKMTSLACKHWFVCFENTGSYSKRLLYWLTSKGIPCREENAMQISRSKGLTRGKDDVIDAQFICLYAYRLRDKITVTQLAEPSIAQMKKLLSRRSLLVRQRASLKASIKENTPDIDASVHTMLTEQNACLIAVYSEQISLLESKIEEIVKSQEDLRTNSELLKSITGIGSVITWYLIANTSNFNAFDNARQFACYSGVAPFPNRSGSSFRGKDRVHYLANKQIKAILTNGANSAIRTDPELRQYYQKKRQEGKAYGTVINAVKNKLIARAFAVIKRQSPFVSLMSYAS